MKIKFKEERDTLLLGRVKPGKVYNISKKEAEAFIGNGVAVKAGENINIHIEGNILDEEAFAKALTKEGK